MCNPFSQHPKRLSASLPSWLDYRVHWDLLHAVRKRNRENSNERPERRTAFVARELRRFNVDIAALSETRLAEEGKLREEKIYLLLEGQVCW